MMEIIYNTENEVVVYSDPIPQRKDPYTGGELDKMEVDEGYNLDPSQLSVNVKNFLVELRTHFASKRGDFVTQKEVLGYTKDHVHFVPVDYGHHSHPVINQWMNRLWKAGLIEKWRRGLWAQSDKPGQRGKSHGIAYWIWN